MKVLSSSLHAHSNEKLGHGRLARDAQRERVHPVQYLTISLSTALRLGLTNVARAAIYRVCKRAGIYKLLPASDAIPLEFSVDLLSDALHKSAPWDDCSALAYAELLLKGRANYFSVHTHTIGNPPNWFMNPFENKAHPQAGQHWSEIPDFGGEVGDIKIIWEMSRFGWATVFARAWRTSGDERYLAALQNWMQNWSRCNHPNTGPNWMCGQETSIRLINALLALRIAGVEKNVGTGLAAFVEAHCRRVDITTSYGVAQDNNHATSEASGLFVGGAWLAKYAEGDERYSGQRWAKKGRNLLNSRVPRLVMPDGSFSQHSLTYHRLMLDTLSIAEAWRRYAGEAPFAEDFYERAAAATRWLGAMIDPATGDGPNLGANDGAHPYHLDGSAYRDFRPCLQLASLLFIGTKALESGPWDESAAWLGVPADLSTRPWLNDLSSTFYPDGGYVIIRNRTGGRVLVRAPTARFRPAHADALHLDFWWRGKNLLRDGGTYAYANGGAVADALASVAGHNVQQFDDHDQMPRLSRFLYGEWVRVIEATAITNSANEQSWTGKYADFWGAEHQRTVILKADELSVLDQVQGFKQKAVLRWRLAPGNWSQTETGCISAMGRIQVESTVPIRRLSLESGWESRHYMEKSTVPVLEVEIDQSPAVLTTTVIPS